MNNVRAFTIDHLNAADRFQCAVRAMGQQNWLQVQTLYQNAPMLVWNGPDPGFQERVRTAETCTRAFIQDLNLVTVKLHMLREFETTLRRFIWKETGGDPQDGKAQLGRLQEVCHTFDESIDDLQTMLASQWQGWSDFVCAAWRLKPDEPIHAWFPNGTDEMLAQIRANPTKPDANQAQAYRVSFDTTWQNTLNAIAKTGIGG